MNLIYTYTRKDTQIFMCKNIHFIFVLGGKNLKAKEYKTISSTTNRRKKRQPTHQLDTVHLKITSTVKIGEKKNTWKKRKKATCYCSPEINSKRGISTHKEG